MSGLRHMWVLDPKQGIRVCLWCMTPEGSAKSKLFCEGVVDP